MYRVFHTGVVLAVAVHMLCGCCLHHAHAHGVRSDARVSAVETGCCHHGDHSHKQADAHGPYAGYPYAGHPGAGHSGAGHSGEFSLSDSEAPLENGSSEHQHCDGQSCVFTRPDTDDSPELLVAGESVVPEVVVLIAPSLSVLELAAEACWRPDELQRLHLLNQAFLL